MFCEKFRPWPYVGIVGRKKVQNNCTVLLLECCDKSCLARGVSAKLRLLAESLHCVQSVLCILKVKRGIMHSLILGCVYHVYLVPENITSRRPLM